MDVSVTNHNSNPDCSGMRKLDEGVRCHVALFRWMLSHVNVDDNTSFCEERFELKVGHITMQIANEDATSVK